MSLTICITWIVFNKITGKHKFLVIFQSICSYSKHLSNTPHIYQIWTWAPQLCQRKRLWFSLPPAPWNTVQICVVFSQSTKESKLSRIGHLSWDFVVAVCHRALMDRSLWTMEAQVMLLSTASSLWSAVLTYQVYGNCPIITVLITNFMLNLVDLSLCILSGYWSMHLSSKYWKIKPVLSIYTEKILMEQSPCSWTVNSLGCCSINHREWGIYNKMKCIWLKHKYVYTFNDSFIIVDIFLTFLNKNTHYNLE